MSLDAGEYFHGHEDGCDGERPAKNVRRALAVTVGAVTVGVLMQPTLHLPVYSPRGILGAATIPAHLRWTSSANYAAWISTVSATVVGSGTGSLRRRIPSIWNSIASAISCRVYSSVRTVVTQPGRSGK